MPGGDASRRNGLLGGRPKGRKNNSTISKEEAREELRRIVLPHLREMVEAQIAKAKGTRYFVKRDKKTKRFIRLRPDEHIETIDLEKYDLEVWDRDPATEAFTDLLNRALDKPKEQKLEVEFTDVNAKLALLDRAKARNRKP